jgi:poly(ADP-ribose) glycohydrolase ARH3
LRQRFGPDGLREYVPWRGWRSGPIGTFTDDTQLTMAVARTVCARPAQFDPERFARELVILRPEIRGIGGATATAIARLQSGEPWWNAGRGENSAGNRAAMRAGPIGLARALQETPAELVADAILSAVPTHRHPVAIAGAVTIAAGVAWCIRARLAGRDQLDSVDFVDFVSGVTEGVEIEPTPERRPGGDPVRLVERVRELPDLLRWPEAADVFAYTYNGAFAIESVPAAVYCFLRTPEDPRQVILTAVNAGYDADTVGSMAGNLAGAWNGARSLERTSPSWWTELESRGELIGLADELGALALKILST